MFEIVLFILTSLLQITQKTQMKLFGIPKRSRINIEIEVIRKSYCEGNTVILGRCYHNSGKYSDLLFRANFPQERLPDNIGIPGNSLELKGTFSLRERDPEFTEKVYNLEQCKLIYS